MWVKLEQYVILIDNTIHNPHFGTPKAKNKNRGRIKSDFLQVKSGGFIW